MNPAAPAVATHIYQLCLLLYPPAFRVTFGVEMASDFDEATTEAWLARGWPGVLALWASTAGDFAWSVTAQWLRTGIPALIVVSVAWSTMMATLIAQQFVPRAPAAATSWLDDDLRILVLGVAVVIVLIAAIILVTGWFWMLVVRRNQRA